ncbi:MAG: hypothetical protein CMQ29_16520 [Gammaproteobacteria bacterium]|jgi:hypothetical protein|nr:hypothetical protein [Gammaproteobacteria bacterium]
MSPFVASLINALILILFAAWGYFASATPSITALIPAAFGVLLLACLPGVKAENKIVAHIAVVLTLIVLVALFMPLRGALGREDAMAAIRAALMMASSAVAMVFFIKSFIDARKARLEAD